MRSGVLTALLAIAGPAAADVSEHAVVDVPPIGRAFKLFTIDNALGDVVVEGYDGTALRIESNKRAPDLEGLDRLRISLVPDPDGTMRLTTTADRDRESKSVKRGAVRIDLKVRVPRDVRIEASTSSGKLSVSNLDNGGELDTASGPIQVHNVAGLITTHSVSGGTSMVSVFGSIDSQTLGSDLDFDSINGERLVASANHGKIAGRRVRSHNVQLTTNDGTIVLEGEASLRGRVALASLKGDIDVRLRRQAQGVVVVRARGATVTLGTQVQQAAADGWVDAQFGPTDKGAIPAFIELRSRLGSVQFKMLDSE